MEKLFESYLKDAKGDVTKLRDLKNLFVKHQQFELASNIRELEKELYPISEQDEKDKNEALVFKSALGLFDLNVDEKMAFTLFNAAKILIEKGEMFDLKDTVKIKALAEKLYH